MSLVELDELVSGFEFELELESSSEVPISVLALPVVVVVEDSSKAGLASQPTKKAPTVRPHALNHLGRRS